MKTKLSLLKSASFKFSLLAVLWLCLAGSGLSACTDKKEGDKPEVRTEKAKTTAAANTQTASSSLQASLVSLVPVDSPGFAFFDTESSGYKRYMGSAWGKMGKSYLNINTTESDNNSTFSFLKELQKAGIDVSDIEKLSNDISSLAIFVDPNSSSSGSPLGFIAKKKSGSSIETKLASLKQSLSKGVGYTLEDKTFGSTTGFHLTVQPNQGGGTPEHVFSAWNSEVAVATPNEASISEILTTTIGKNLPNILKSPNFKSASDDTADIGEVYGYAYIDFEKAISLIKDTEEAKRIANQPFKALSLNFGMKENPANFGRLTYDTAKMTALQNGWTLKNSPLGITPSLLTRTPILFLSLDGAMIHALFASMKSSNPALTQLLAPYESSVGSIIRFSIVASNSSGGKSLLPIPDLLLTFGSTKPDELRKTIMALGTMASAMSGGMATGEWKNKAIEGQFVDSIETPMGIGLYITQIKDTIVIASTIQQITDAIQASKNDALSAIKTLPPEIAKSLTDDQNMGSVLVSYFELSSFLRGMRDIAGMYDPSKTGSAFMTDEYLDNMRNLGFLFGTTKNNGDFFDLNAVCVTATK